MIMPMKNKILKQISLLLLTMLLSALSLPVSAYDGIPDTIAIGLYYASTAKSSCTVTSTGGIGISISNEYNNWMLTEDTSVNQVLVKKDNTYHAELSESFSDYESAWKKKSTLRAEGYPAFTAYRDGAFYIWIGAYPTESEAKQVADSIGAKVLTPHSKRSLVYCGDLIWMGVQDEFSHLTIYPTAGVLALDGVKYRGKLKFMRLTTGDMTVVNIVGFDDYLCGVVPREVTATWSYEAVKAQAVLSRTFAINNMNKYQKYGFNLDNTTNSQAYAGVKIEHEASNRAIGETHNQIVLYNGKPAQVYFFASSGGKTGTANDAWGGDNYPYLQSVDDSYENANEASYAHWTLKYTADELKAKLAQKDVHIGDITDVTVEYSDSGRALKTVFHGTEGMKEYSRENIRWVIGAYSTAFTVSRSGGSETSLCTLDAYNSFTPISVNAQTNLLSANGIVTGADSLFLLSAEGMTQTEGAKAATGDFIFSGRGWGHGVGMSQWGAKGMAEAGFSYTDIIQHYFKGTEIG